MSSASGDSDPHARPAGNSVTNIAAFHDERDPQDARVARIDGHTKKGTSRKWRPYSGYAVKQQGRSV